MKNIDLLYYVTFGKNDSSDTMPYTISVSDEEFDVYEKAIADKKPLNETTELQGILDIAYREIEEMEIQNGIDFEDEFVLECQGLLEDEEYDEDFEPESPFDCGWTLNVFFDDPNFKI